jgi:hypothetical protein
MHAAGRYATLQVVAKWVHDEIAANGSDDRVFTEVHAFLASARRSSSTTDAIKAIQCFLAISQRSTVDSVAEEFRLSIGPDGLVRSS